MVVGYVLIRQLHSRVNIQYFVYFIFLILLKTIVTVKHIHYLCIFNLDVDLLLACILHLVFLFCINILLVRLVLDLDWWVNDILLELDLVDLGGLRRLVHWLDILL